MENELKPCLKCDGSNLLIQEVYVKCNDCDLYIYAETPELAIKAWNTRPEPKSELKNMLTITQEQLVDASNRNLDLAIELGKFRSKTKLNQKDFTKQCKLLCLNTYGEYSKEQSLIIESESMVLYDKLGTLG